MPPRVKAQIEAIRLTREYARGSHLTTCGACRDWSRSLHPQEGRGGNVSSVGLVSNVPNFHLPAPEAHNKALGWPSSPCHNSRSLPAPGAARRLQLQTQVLGGERTAAGAIEPTSSPAQCWLAAAAALHLRAKKGTSHCSCSQDLSCTSLSSCLESCGAKSFIFFGNKNNAAVGPAGIPPHAAKPTAGACSAACKPLPSAALTLQ